MITIAERIRRPRQDELTLPSLRLRNLGQLYAKLYLVNNALPPEMKIPNGYFRLMDNEAEYLLVATDPGVNN